MAKEVKSKLRKEGDFIPPDGGWGWIIIFAAGFSNLSVLPMLQQFGLLFRDRFSALGITSSQTTTVINVNSALTSCVGLLNGPMFRKFTYRQVSLFGATLCFVSLLMTTFSFNFITYLISFSILYGYKLSCTKKYKTRKDYYFSLYKSTAGPEAFPMYHKSDTLEDLPILIHAGQAGWWAQYGALALVMLLPITSLFGIFGWIYRHQSVPGAGYGINAPGNALALNTYWKNRRRLATSLSWTTTGLGPMIWPHVIAFLFAQYGETGTLLVISAFGLHAIVCALLLHPVEWHSKKSNTANYDAEKLKDQEADENDENKEIGYFRTTLKRLSTLSGQYLYNEDDPITPGYEITDPGTPMMLRSNDGYYSKSRPRSRVSSINGTAINSRMASKKPSMINMAEIRSRKPSNAHLYDLKKNSSANLAVISQDWESKKRKLIAARQESIEETALNALQENDKDVVSDNIDLNVLSKRPSATNLAESRSRKSSLSSKKDLRKNLTPNVGNDWEAKQIIILDDHIPESEIEDCPTLKAPQDLKAEEKAIVEKLDPVSVKNISERAEKHMAGSKSIKSFKMDGQYSEKYKRDNHSNISLKKLDDNDDRQYLKDNHSNQSTKHRRKSNNFNFENEVLKLASLKLEEYLLKENEKKTHLEQKLKLLINNDDENDYNEDFEEEDLEAEEENLTLCEKIYMYFDLDLLKDFTFINLMLGITLANFNELNFSILTPFILGDIGQDKSQVAHFMSLLGGMDVSTRICIPFIAAKIGWDNNTFFLFGVLLMAIGRVILAHYNSYSVTLLIAIIIGFGKAFRTVFMALVIPTHVPLNKLPGASGLQLITAGVVYLALGPFVGWIKDNSSTAFTLHCLNIFTWITALSWGLEKYIRAKQNKNVEDNTDNL